MRKQELEELKNKYDNQELMPTDVERMKEESEALKRQIKELDNQEELLDSQTYKVNITMAKITEKVSHSLQWFVWKKKPHKSP